MYRRLMHYNTWPMYVGCLAWLLIALALGLAQGAGTAMANGGTRTLVKDEKAGPYELRVGISPGAPTVGVMHLSVIVRDPVGDKAITGATVMVSVTGPEGATPFGPVPALSTPNAPEFYDLNIPLDAEGAWALDLMIDGPLGPGNLVLPLQVTSSGGFSLVFLAAAAIALLAASVWTWDRIKRRGQKRGRTA